MNMLGIFPKQRQKLARALFAATLSLATSSASEFVPLGDLPGGDNFSVAFDLSGDGSTVLGIASDDGGTQIVRWKSDTGFSLVAPFDAQTISGDGSTVAGSTFTDRLTAVLWNEAGGIVSLESPPIDPLTSPFTVALDISGDGSTAVGVGATLASPFSEALLWNSEGVRELGFLEEDLPEPGFFSFSFANAVSADGTVVVGASSSTKHIDRGEQAYRWTEATGMQPLGFLPEAFESQATVVSADGAVVAGTSGGGAFRWTEANGMEAIGPFLPLGISGDGSVIVGRADTELGSAAYVWTATEGPLPLATWLEQKHDLVTTDWILSEAIGISDDGLKIAGTGINSSGNSEAFLVVLGAGSDRATTATITITGAAAPLIVDASGRRYGFGAEPGSFYNEIPELAATSSSGTLTLSWPNLEDGTYQVILTGAESGDYSLHLNFLHADSSTSGHAFTGTLGTGGVHKFTAQITAASASGSIFAQVFADSDGDGLIDSEDANPNSDLRPTVIIGGIDTGLDNLVLRGGVTLNDAVLDLMNSAGSRNEFLNLLNKAIKNWVDAGVFSPNEKHILMAAARDAEQPGWTSTGKRK